MLKMRVEDRILEGEEMLGGRQGREGPREVKKHSTGVFGRTDNVVVGIESSIWESPRTMLPC